jgi:hypothetical protein
MSWPGVLVIAASTFVFGYVVGGFLATEREVRYWRAKLDAQILDAQAAANWRPEEDS